MQITNITPQFGDKSRINAGVLASAVKRSKLQGDDLLLSAMQKVEDDAGMRRLEAAFQPKTTHIKRSHLAALTQRLIPRAVRKLKTLGIA